MESIVETKASSILQFIHGLRGELHVTWGTNSITAVYGGDSNNSGSTSAPVNQFVSAATTTTLTCSPNPSAVGQAVMFTATVTSSVGAPPDGEA